MIRRAVLDVSAAVEVVLLGSRAAPLADALEACPLVLVPGLFHAEVANALWKYVRLGNLAAEEAVTLLETAFGLADRVVPDRDLAEEALIAAASANGRPRSFSHAAL